jgi:L-lysine exporter family protein LysE/ArgO
MHLSIVNSLPSQLPVDLAAFVPVFLLGTAASLGLIIAIGAQNAFVLRQGLRRDRVGWVVAVSIASDVALIAIGTAGLAWVSSVLPRAVPLLTAGGAAFLLLHGLQAARRAWHPTASGVAGASGPALSRRAAVAQAAAFAWLNPHAWLDTTVLLGALAQAQAQTNGPGFNWVFAGGAASGSALWFVTLAWAAQRLAPWFGRPMAWRAFDAGVALMMLALAGGLLVLLWRGGLPG